MIRIACSKCRTVFQLGDDLAGKKIRCRTCATILAVPGRPGAKPVAKAAAAGAAGAKAAAGGAKAAPANAAPSSSAHQPEVITPYSIKPPEEIPEEAKDNRIDQMVRTNERQKRRNRAWSKVGPPATYLKWFTLAVVGLATAAFLWWLVCCTLMGHKWEQLMREHSQGWEAKAKELRWTFPLDDLFTWQTSVWYVLGLGCAVYFPLMFVCGMTLMGTENTRRLENYKMAMTGACFGLLILPLGPLLGLLCIVRLRDPEVIHEFEISDMRREGIDWEAIEDEELAAEEEEENEEDEEEDEEEETPRRRR